MFLTTNKARCWRKNLKHFTWNKLRSSKSKFLLPKTQLHYFVKLGSAENNCYQANTIHIVWSKCRFKGSIGMRERSRRRRKNFPPWTQLKSSKIPKKSHMDFFVNQQSGEERSYSIGIRLATIKHAHCLLLHIHFDNKKKNTQYFAFIAVGHKKRRQ